MYKNIKNLERLVKILEQKKIEKTFKVSEKVKRKKVCQELSSNLL